MNTPYNTSNNTTHGTSYIFTGTNQSPNSPKLPEELMTTIFDIAIKDVSSSILKVMVLNKEYYLKYRTILYKQPLHIKSNNVYELIYGLIFELALRFKQEDVGYLGSCTKLEDAIEVIRSKVIYRTDKPFEAHVRKMDSLNLVTNIIFEDFLSALLFMEHIKYNDMIRVKGNSSIAKTLVNVTTISFEELMFPQHPLNAWLGEERFKSLFSSIRKHFNPTKICIHEPESQHYTDLVTLHRFTFNIGSFIKEWIKDLSSNLLAEHLIIHHAHHIDTSLSELFEKVEIFLSKSHILSKSVYFTSLLPGVPRSHQIAFDILCDQLPHDHTGKTQVYNASVLNTLGLESIIEEASKRHPNVVHPSLQEGAKCLSFEEPQLNESCSICGSRLAPGNSGKLI